LNPSILLITPPFTQLNTPYPATAYLKGFFNTQNIQSHQCDLGIEVILELFSSKGFAALFKAVENKKVQLSSNSQRIFNLRLDYCKTIDAVIDFLQNKNPTVAHLICEGDFLPEASRFQQLDDLEWAFGTMGTHDKARHLATLYLEDVSDLIVEALDPHFGFSRYAERLGRSANSFDELHHELQKPDSFIDKILLELLKTKIENINPGLVCLSVPFPGNLYSAFKTAQWIKKNHPEIKIAFGGGFANTELRSLSDARVFAYIDFVTLDDGETPLLHLIDFLAGNREKGQLKRTFALDNNNVVYYNGSTQKDVAQKDVGTPDYNDLLLNKYLSVIEIANPMHRLWSDGRWNKLTLAHGCYWGKCTFCDISLDYIKRYEPSSAILICDRIEELIKQTGQNGFHFVDEAAPPALMRDVALEILKRKLTVAWWTNIRFEKSFTKDLCVLLKESGCIAVSGGLEVASDRLLDLIEKGVTVEQVTKVADNFTQAGIMVHAYLMHGFPTQTAQETIDSMEVVRQLFEQGVLQSAFWHRFAMTAHAPVGLDPKKFKMKLKTVETGTFANNDLVYVDEVGCDHDAFSDGLKKSLFNYMHGICFEFPLNEWFDFKVPKTKIASNYIETILNNNIKPIPKAETKLVWLGNMPQQTKLAKKGKNEVELLFSSKKNDFKISIDEFTAQWLVAILQELSPNADKTLTFSLVEKKYQDAGLKNFELFVSGKVFSKLCENGLILV
jgi:hypothetical protein